MRFLRHSPCPLVPSTADSRPTNTPTTGGMISRSRLHTRAHRRRARTTHGSRSRLAKRSSRNHGSGHHSSTALTSYAFVTLLYNRHQRRTAAFSRTLLTNEYWRVGKWIECFIRSSNFQTSFNIPTSVRTFFWPHFTYAEHLHWLPVQMHYPDIVLCYYSSLTFLYMTTQQLAPWLAYRLTFWICPRQDLLALLYSSLCTFRYLHLIFFVCTLW